MLRLGPRAADFLQAYATNAPTAAHGAFVNAQGRIVAVYGQVPLGREESLIVVGRLFVRRLADHLARYLSVFESELLPIDYSVYHDLDGLYAPAGDEHLIRQKTGAWVITHRSLAATVSDEDYTRFRVRHELPLQGIDYDEEMILNVLGDDHIAYSKGCYLGQEIIARVHYRGQPSKRLVVKGADQCSPLERERMTSAVTDPQTGKTAGFVIVNERPEG